MREEPSGSELLSVARDVLRERLLDQLPADCRYDALMIANAMAIAARQIDAGEEHHYQELRRLARLFEVPVQEEDHPAQVLDLNRRIVAEIRRGDYDPGSPRRRAVLDHLRTTVRDSVLESNPKYLSEDA